MQAASLPLGRTFDLPDSLSHRPIDPYLLWAQLTRWSELHGRAPDSLPVAIELKRDHAGKHLVEAASRAGLLLRMPPVYAERRFLTAQVSHEFLEGWYLDDRLGAAVERIELGLPMTVDLGFALRDSPPSGQPGPCLIGIVDHGFAFAHQDFTRLDATGGWKSRIVTLWDQDTTKPAFASVAGAQPPPTFGFGREINAGHIESLRAAHPRSESAAHEAAGYSDLRRRATHGAHVAGLAAGRLPPSHRLDFGVDPPRSGFGAGSSTPPPEPALRAPLALVQLPRAAVQDASGRWLSVHMLDALHHVLGSACPGQRVVVNISYGSRVGPHDGTALLEQAMLDLLASTNTPDHRLDIVLAAGNAFGARSHAVLEVPAEGAATLGWQVAAGSEASTFAELWLPEGVDARDIEVCLVPPAATGAAPIRVRGGQVASWIDSVGRVLASVVFPQKSALGKRGTCAVLTIAPTWQRGAGVRAPAGRWRVEVRLAPGAGPAGVGALLHAYLARNDADYGMPRRGRPSHFIAGEGYDLGSRYLRRADDDAVPALSPVQRLGTLSWNARAPGLHVVAGHVLRPCAPTASADAVRLHPPYSAAGPARDAPRTGPDVAMPTDASPIWRGVRGAGTRGTSTVRLIGTSAAAPMWVRVLVNGVPGPGRHPQAPPTPPNRDDAFYGDGLHPAP